ncbi:Sugar transporter [Sphingomonas sp. EC-HK361]|uniref:polysaccharide biosynthesis/export family protein n=1 Tax=Sphingomonas sp. EC-HK361 TaxID=2038397 RepID=UPI00125808AF|nr:polysaccharide biosynthesis/export family protein [Sphingomonas sp. EC-HK361]VVT22499.1 Sugar transporter [Sphingomonas sp. EC-HK361]
MGTWFNRAVALTMMAVTASCSSGMSGLDSLPPAPVAAYRLGAGDEIRVMVPGLATPDTLNATYVVNDRGQLSLPLLGDIDANGKTVPELQQAIAAQLMQRQLLNTPTVSVQPVRLRPFYVLGEVKTPGEYQYRPGISVLAAVSVAGGYTFRAQQGTVEVVRMINGRQVTGRAGPTDMVQPGDTIRVHEKWF